MQDVCLVVAWDRDYIQAKALTTHHNLSQGFNEALDQASTALGLDRYEVLSGVDSVRYATTLGTNALIERAGPQVGALVTAGFDATIPLSRGRCYGEGLDELGRNDLSAGTRPDPLVPQRLIRSVRERVDYSGVVLMALDEEDVRRQLGELIDAGAEALVVCLTNAVENPVHERRVQEIFLEEYPAHQLGAIPMLLSHQLSGRKGEYVRATSTIIDAFLHSTMYFGLSELEQNLREHGYAKPMLVNHNTGGMAQLNSTDALQTIHSGPVAGIAASEQLAGQAGLGNVVATRWSAGLSRSSRWPSASPCCATGCMTSTGSSPGPWPIRSSPACWPGSTPGWYCWPPTCSACTRRWRWPPPHWPRRRSSIPCGGGCGCWWTGVIPGPV